MQISRLHSEESEQAAKSNAAVLTKGKQYGRGTKPGERPHLQMSRKDPWQFKMPGKQDLMTESASGRRDVKSFVRRTGRITPAQGRALVELWPAYGIDYAAKLLNLDEIFGRSAKKVLEIGFGNGESLVRAAEEQPEIDFLGVEVHEPGIGHCLIASRERNLANIRIIKHDAVEVLQHQLEDGVLARINLYFPDPWPKKRHHKRRLVQASFLQMAAAKLVAAGTLHIATDWENYAEHIDALIAQSSEFTLAARQVHKNGSPSPERQTTKFERRGLRAGHNIWDWCLVKK